MRLALKLAPLLLVALAAAPFFGPPRITVTEPRGTPPVAGAVLLVDAQHHTDEKDPDVSGRAITTRNGQRVSKAISLAKYGEAGHFAVTKQWDSGTPWVLVFTIKQGDHGTFDTAESLVQIDATGKVVSIEAMMQSNARGDRYPRKAEEADITRALSELGVRAQR